MTVLDVSVGADTDSHAMYSNHSINNLFADVKSIIRLSLKFRAVFASPERNALLMRKCQKCHCVTLGKSNRTEKARILRRQIKTMKDR